MSLTPEQLAARKVGGSDVATILGLNPWATPLELYAEKRGEVDREDLSDNENVEAGEVLEDGIATLAARRLSRREGHEIKLRRCNLTLSNPQYPWLTAHIDRDVVGRELGVELKNVGARAARYWGEPGTDEIPDYYLPQPHTYMIVKAYPAWITAGYFGGADMRLYDIERDPEFADMIIERTHDFWFNNVLKGVPPPFDPEHPAALDAVRRVYRGTSGEVMRADPQHMRWRTTMQEFYDRASELKGAADVIKAQLLHAMGDASILRFEDGYDLVRKQVKRAGYTVEPTVYIDSRITKTKEKA